MKKKVLMMGLAVLTIGLLGSCSKIYERLDNLDKRVDGIQNDQIATISSQVASINSSISDLGSIRTSIQEFRTSLSNQGTEIDALKGTDADLAEQIADLQAGGIDIVEMIASLDKADEALEKRIEELKGYIEGDLHDYAKIEWVEATFSTLEQYELTCELIAGINEDLKEVGLDLEELAGRVSGLETDLKKLETTVGEYDARIEELRKTTASLESLIANVAYNIRKEIENSVEGMKTWVNEQLGGYYTAAEMDAQIKALQAKIEEVSETETDDIKELEKEIGKTSKELSAEIAKTNKELEAEKININRR